MMPAVVLRLVLLPALVASVAVEPHATVLQSSTTDRCAECQLMMHDARTKWLAELHDVPAAGRLAAFRRDVGAVFHDECETILGDHTQCVHCEECAATAPASVMDHFVSMDGAGLCRLLTNGTVCSTSLDDASSALTKAEALLGRVEAQQLNLWDVCGW